MSPLSSHNAESQVSRSHVTCRCASAGRQLVPVERQTLWSCSLWSKRQLCLTLSSKNGQEVPRQGSGLGVTGASPAQQVSGGPASPARFPFATSVGFWERRACFTESSRSAARGCGPSPHSAPYLSPPVRGQATSPPWPVSHR